MTFDPFGSARTLAASLHRRDISCLEALEVFIARMERYNPQLNAIVATDLDSARARARQADDALRKGEVWGPLHGLPMTIKDTFEVAGMPTTSGAPELARHFPSRNAAAVEKLIAAGAVIFGKTNTPLYGMDLQTYNDVYGTTNNPWDPTRTPGGSSGGPAAALAAGLTPLELGSDIGGSIRNPSHCCGVYGHKSSYGIVSSQGHIPGPPGTLSEADLVVVGPLARSAEDLSFALDVLAGPSELDRAAWRLTLPPPRRTSLRDYRVACWLDDAFCPIDQSVLDRLTACVEALRTAGVRVSETARPGFSLADNHRVYFRLLTGAISSGLKPYEFAALAASQPFVEMARALGLTKPGQLGDFISGATQRHAAWAKANEARERMRRQWRAFFQEYDVLLAPIIPVTAIPHRQQGNIFTRKLTVNGRQRPYLDFLVWAGLVTVSYLPATLAPVGLSDTGLPVGIQIIGPYLEDRTPLDFAARLGALIGGFTPPPGFAA